MIAIAAVAARPAATAAKVNLAVPRVAKVVVALAAAVVLAVVVTLAIGTRLAAAQPRAGDTVADPVHLPALGSGGSADDTCISWIRVQNPGPGAAQALLVLWGAARDIQTPCAGAGSPGGGTPVDPSQGSALVGIECTGLLAPGAGWQFGPPLLAQAAVSGIVYSFNDRRVAAGRPSGPSGAADRLVGDEICRTLRRGLDGESPRVAEFQAAYQTGAEFDGMTLAGSYGDRPAVTVERRCRDGADKLRVGDADYEGIGRESFGVRDAVAHWSSYYAGAVATGRSAPEGATDLATVLHIQNAGLSCANVEVWLQSQAQCGRLRLCRTLTLPPGASGTVPATGCVERGWHGGAWIRGSEPLAIVADQVRPGVLASYEAVPAELRDDPGRPATYQAGGTQAFGPLLVDSPTPWHAAVHVQNLSSTTSAFVQVTYQDSCGLVLADATARLICPRGTGTFELPAARARSSGLGGVRVVSSMWRAQNGHAYPAQNVSAVAELWRLGDGTGVGTSEEHMAYNLPIVPETVDGPFREARSGAGLLAVPFTGTAAYVPGVTARLVVANLVPGAGFTRLAVLHFDQNALAGTQCVLLGAGEVIEVGEPVRDLVTPNFLGSALISAVAWDHPVFDPQDRLVDNVVSLAAVSYQHAVARDGGQGLSGADLSNDTASGAVALGFTAGSLSPSGFEALAAMTESCRLSGSGLVRNHCSDSHIWLPVASVKK